MFLLPGSHATCKAWTMGSGFHSNPMEFPIVSVQKWIWLLISSRTVRWKRQNDLAMEVEMTEKMKKMANERDVRQ